MSRIKDFKDLRIWESGIEIVKKAYSISNSFPQSEQFGLSNQVRRAAISIPSNIAEGHVKNQTKEFIRYLSIAIGSCAEVETQVIIANELGWLREEDYQLLLELVKAETRQINVLKKRLTES